MFGTEIKYPSFKTNMNFCFNKSDRKTPGGCYPASKKSAVSVVRDVIIFQTITAREKNLVEIFMK